VAALLAGLEGIDPETDTYEREVADKPIYWVHIPPQRTAQDARRAQKELVSRGVESFVISDLGSLHNGISLGVFRDQKSAEMLAQRRQDIGYPVAIHESQRKRVAHFARMRAEVAKADLLVPAIAERAVGMSGEANVSIVVCAGET
jgi:pyruvate/oxaloacetate carboxyltransferase